MGDSENLKPVLKGLALIFSLSLSSCSDDVPRQATATENVTVLSQEFEIKSLGRKRKVRIYLPTDYQNSDRRYSVLYMHDGQNLFDDATSYAGEWGIDEALNRLYKEKGFSLIVVGIDNGLDKRMNELGPWDHSKFGKSEAEEYLSFIIQQVKPYIDSNYRTLPYSESAGIMGSSMGGLISHYAAFKYPDVFSKIGVFSPSYWYSHKVYDFSNVSKLNESQKLFFMTGGKEGVSVVPDFNKMIEHLKSQGLSPENYYAKIVPDGEHNEALWKAEFAQAVTWLFAQKDR